MNKLSEQDQYNTVLQYLEWGLKKYKNKKIEVNSTDFFKLTFPQPPSTVHPNEIDFDLILEKMEKKNLLRFEKHSSEHGIVYLNKEELLKEFRKKINPTFMPKQGQQPTINIIGNENVTLGDYSPISVKSEFKDFEIKIDKSDLPNKEEIKEKIQDLSYEAKKKSWNITKIQSLLQYFKKLPSWIYLQAIKTILAYLENPDK